MGIVQVEELRLRQQEIEVRALVALANCNNEVVVFKARRKLERIAYPEDIDLWNNTQLLGFAVIVKSGTVNVNVEIGKNDL